MYLRRKKNVSGSISIQIANKVRGKVKIIKSIGSSKDFDEIEALYQQGLEAIKLLQDQFELPFHQSLEKEFVAQFISSIQSLSLVGPELLLGKIFDEIGFHAIEDELFRHLVITRLVYPVSNTITCYKLVQ